MPKLPVADIVRKISNEEIFTCESEDGGFTLIIENYVPYVCAAIHNGENLRRELRLKCKLSKAERWYEEDPHTADFIAALPIRIIGNDSRYEYDLNRGPENCVYEEAWGKKVWKKPLTKAEKEHSQAKHAAFYEVVDALIAKLQNKFKACVVYDIHSYNYKRFPDDVTPPLFNVGTENVSKKFSPFVKDWLERLEIIESDFFINQTRENDVFFGRGNFLKHITKKFKNTLVLATEVRKSYCDELTGDVFPEVVEDIKIGMRKAVIENAKLFANKKTNFSAKRKHDLLATKIEPLVSVIDNELVKIAKSFDLLEFVNPKNLEAAKKQFFKNKFRKNPVFKYKPLDIDLSDYKRTLYKLPIDLINDITLYKIYKDVVDSYVDQIEMLAFRGDRKFKYMSLKHFGEPSEEDVELAKLILSAPTNKLEQSNIGAEDALKQLKKEMHEYGFNGKIETIKNIPSEAIFIPSKKTLRIKKDAKFANSFLTGLCHHEIGVHMLTTENASKQQLKILESGLPLDTMTQEGLAILSEYKAGILTINRLKELALRVMAVWHMLKNDDFKETFTYLIDRYGVNEDKAFYITARAYRGGGLTKDYVYLKGFKIMKNLIDQKKDLSHLLIGKTSIEYSREIKELINRGILAPPEFVTRSFGFSNEKDPVIEFLLSGINSESL